MARDELNAAQEADLSLSGNELSAVWAALVAMVEDNHSPQDCLTAAQWEAAAGLLSRITSMIEEPENSNAG